MLAVIPISALKTALTRWHSRRVYYLYCEGMFCLLIRAGYIQLGLGSIQNLLLCILNPGIAWGGVGRLLWFAHV